MEVTPLVLYARFTLHPAEVEGTSETSSSSITHHSAEGACIWVDAVHQWNSISSHEVRWNQYAGQQFDVNWWWQVTQLSRGTPCCLVPSNKGVELYVLFVTLRQLTNLLQQVPVKNLTVAQRVSKLHALRETQNFTAMFTRPASVNILHKSHTIFT